MPDDVRVRRVERLSSMPAGFPTTPFGAGPKVPQKFDSERRAEIAAHIGQAPGPAPVPAVRLNMDPDADVGNIATTAARGRLFRFSIPQGTLRNQRHIPKPVDEVRVPDR